MFSQAVVAGDVTRGPRQEHGLVDLEVTVRHPDRSTSRFVLRGSGTQARDLLEARVGDRVAAIGRLELAYDAGIIHVVQVLGLEGR